jgi:choline-sulfatase
VTRTFFERSAELEDGPTAADMRRAEPGLFAYYAKRREQWSYDEVTPEQLLSITRAYYASLAWSDHCIGRILAHLEASGLAEDTLVIYTSDHGESLGEHGMLQKRNFYEGAMRVPCLFRLPGRIPAGSAHPRVAQHIDLVATLFDILPVDAPEGLEGRSMKAGLLGEGGAGWDNWEDFAIAEMALASTRPRRTPGVLPAKFGWMLRHGSYKFVDHGAGEAALYDLAVDPAELENLAVAPDQAGRVEHMRAFLQQRIPARWAYHHHHREAPEKDAEESSDSDGR